jgi:HlyD family secretion protein
VEEPALQRRTKAFAAAAVLVLGGLLAWAFAPRPVAVETALVTRGDFETTIDEDGRTRLAERYVVSAPLAGRLTRITLREGDPVQAGAVVATLLPVLAPMPDERTLEEQRLRVQTAQAIVQRAVTRIERARVGLQQVQSELRRSEQLARDGFIAPTKLDSDRLAVQAAQREVESAIGDRRVADQELQVARAALGSVQGSVQGRSGRAFTVRSPVAGRVLRVHEPSEATVTLGTPLLEIGDTAQLEVVAELLTTDALQAAPGSAVRIERWGGPGTLEGRVRQVEPAAFTKVSALGVEEQRVNVLIDISSPHETWAALGDGFRVAVRIVTRTVDDAVQVPTSAVFPLPAGEGHGVFLVDSGRARQASVTLGARSGNAAWIREGLQSGQTVIVYPPAAVGDGVRVRERRV